MNQFARIEPWSADIVGSSFENWPEELQTLALARPISSLQLSGLMLGAVLSQNGAYRAHRRLPKPVELPGLRTSTKMCAGDVFLKLGPVSWKEHAGFVRVSSELLDTMLPIMLRSITERMATVAYAFQVEQAPISIHVFPYIDLSNAWEARFTIEDGALVSARWTVPAQNGKPPAGMGSKLSGAAARIASASGLENALLDLVYQSDTEDGKIRVVEINPLVLDAGYKRLLRF